MKDFIRALDKYREGEIKLDELDEAYLEAGSFPYFSNFINDAGLRGEDPAYSVMQEKALAHFIKLLKSGDIEAAEKVSFKEEL